MADPAYPAQQHVFDRPVFIVAAPRSGSTLLFETLSNGSAFWTVGGEAHELFEGIPKLRVGAPGIDSNRLTAASADDATSTLLRARITDALVDRNGSAYNAKRAARVRLLEKTPKNSLRIPFLSSVFPDALFIYLYREARENISSIMEAWRAGGWVTYRNLPGWEGPWSLLLPPAWSAMRDRPLVEVAAFQWQASNDYILQDLEAIEPSRWAAVSYADLIADPAREVRRLCRFAGVPFDRHLAAVTESELPLSRYTQTRPKRDKWRKNAEALGTVNEVMEKTTGRIQQAVSGKPVSENRQPQKSEVAQKPGRNDPCPCGSGKKFKRCHGAVS